MYALFFRHLRTTIASITIWLNTAELEHNRDVDVKIVEEFMKDIAIEKAKQKAAAAAAAENPSAAKKGKGKGKAPEPEPEDAEEDDDQPELPGDDRLASIKRRDAQAAKNDTMRYLKSLMSLDRFYDYFMEMRTAMHILPFNRIQRVGGGQPMKVLTTSGLHWNIRSGNRGRDFSQIAACAVLESATVSSYRHRLINSCPGIVAFRDDLVVYFTENTEPITEEDFADSAMMEHEINNSSEIPWSFADRVLPAYSVDLTDDCNGDILEEQLEESKKIADIRYSNDIKKALSGMLNSPYLECSGDGISPGTLESSAYHLLNALYKVTHLSRPSRHCTINYDNRPTDHVHKPSTHDPRSQFPRNALRP